MRLYFKETLVFYDEPQVVVAADSIETRYICVHAKREQNSSVFCCVAVSINRLCLFRNGELDLLSLLLNRETDSWFEARLLTSPHNEFHAEQRTSEIPSAYLPDAGFVIESEPTQDTVTEVARQRANVIVEIVLDPPESGSHKISARTLSSALSAIQSVMKYAQAQVHRRAAHSHPSKTDAHILDVLAFTPGSFGVQFESRAGLDLFGSSNIEEALALVETLFENVGDPNSAIEAFIPYRGHLISSIVRLLTLIINAQSNLAFSWTTPGFTKARFARIAKRDASSLLAILAKHRELSVERVSVSGRLTKADEQNRSWRIIDEINKVGVAGKIRRGGTASLSGLIIDQRYRIECEEEFHEDQVTGRDVRKLFAVEFIEL